MKPLKNFRALIGIILLVLLLRASTISSFLLGNAAWTNFNHVLHQDSLSDENLKQITTQFKNAQLPALANQSAWLGEGLAYALRGEIELAYASWSEGEVAPEVLTQYGLKVRQDGQFDAALIMFRGAELLSYEVDSEAIYLAISICQQTFALPALLNENNAQFCRIMLGKNERNLLLNGDANTGTLYGWQGDYFFTNPNKALSSVEYAANTNGPVFTLVGNSASNHFGLFQRLSLPAGAKVRFSGRFKVEAQDGLQARLLYIGWRGTDGKPGGNHGAWQNSDLGWTRFERVFIVPESEGSFIDFYPVVFSGEGKIWFDDLRLELVTS